MVTMMSKTIKVNLSANSIKNAVKELKFYKEEIRFKTSIFVQRLSDLGVKVIDAHKYSHGDSDFNDLRTYAWLEESGSNVKVTLVLYGKDVAFIEFGAGVAYNGAGGTSPNPYGQPLGMIIGSYGKGHGLEDYWFYLDDETNEWVMSKGTEAAMPMYYADTEIHKQFIEIAKEVFK